MSDSFIIQGADNQPIEVPPGHYYFTTKARTRRMMKNSLSSDARRVYACLEMATMGYKHELAVIMDDGKQRPLTSSDICKQTGLSKQHVRHGLAELEEQGLAKREPTDGGGLRKGEIRIYSWATPLTQVAGQNGSRARLPFPDWFPDSWAALKPLITRLKLSVSIDEVAARGYLSDGAEAAMAYENAMEVAARFLERICAPPPPPIYKDRKDSKDKESVCLSKEGDTPEAPTDRPAPPEEFPEPEPEPAPVKQPVKQAQASTADLEKLLQPLCHKLKDTPTRYLLQDTLKILGEAPLPYLEARIQARWDKITRLGMVMLLAGDAAKVWATEQEQRAASARQAGSWFDMDAQIRRAAEAVLRDPDTPERDKELARIALGQQPARGG